MIGHQIGLVAKERHKSGMIEIRKCGDTRRLLPTSPTPPLPLLANPAHSTYKESKKALSCPADAQAGRRVGWKKSWLEEVDLVVGMLVWVALVCVCGISAYREQRVAVKGRLRCGRSPASHARLELYNLDYEGGQPTQVILDDGFADLEGWFRLQARVRKLWPLQPRLRILHTCLKGPLQCPSLATLRLPPRYVNGPTFHLGDWNLEALSDEANHPHDC